MPVGIGIIGCGAVAQRRHALEARSHKHARLVAIADINLARAREWAAPTGALAYRDYRKLLDDPKVEAVVVATPNVYHAQQTVDAFEAGKHVMVEKPMAVTRAECQAMIRAAKRAKRVLMVAHNQRTMSPHVKAKKILDSGELGKVMSFRTSFQHPGPEGWSVDGPFSWFFEPDKAIMGVCGDLGVHKIDLMRYLLNDEFESVAGYLATRDKKDRKGRPLQLDDTAFFSLRTRSGALGTMTISWTNYGRYEDNTTTIFARNGVMVIGADRDYGVIIHRPNGKVDRIRTGAISTNTKQLHSGMMDMFVTAIRTNTRPMIDGEEGYKAVNVILAAMESARSGKRVKVKN